MSEPAPIAAAAPARPDVRAAIAHAANATGVDFSYLLGQARLESSLDPAARANTSSAAGLYQFTAGTWLATLDRHGAEHGYGWAGATLGRGAAGARAQALALRHDPQAAALMAAELANDNRAALSGVLGREPDPAELYLAHFLGADGAGRFLSALAADPGQSAAALLPRAAAANRAVFFERGGAVRSLGAVMELVRGKLQAAMGDTGPEPATTATGWGLPGWSGAAVADSSQPPAASLEPAGAQARPSMAETLAATFGASASAMPAHVRGAYARLKVFGL